MNKLNSYRFTGFIFIIAATIYFFVEEAALGTPFLVLGITFLILSRPTPPQ